MTVLPECVIIKYLINYSIYISKIQYINISKDFKELSIIYGALKDLQESIPNVDKTLDELEAYVYASYPNLTAVSKEAIGLIFTQLRETDISQAVVEQIMDEIQQRHIAQMCAVSALEYAEGRITWDKFLDNTSSLKAGKPHTNSEIIFVTDDLESLKEMTVSKPGLRWRLNSLNRSLGSLRGGDFGFIFARPERGKTTLLASETTYMASQADKPVIWLNNEEQGEKVKVRSFQGALGITSQELFSDVKKYKKAYDEITRGNHRIYDEAALHRRDVERILSSVPPGLVIFDQIDKIKGFDADRPDIVFGRIYQWARELAKSLACPVIGICQSDGTGEGVKWLTMSHVAEAKTSKQAEADWILGVGAVNQDGYEMIRYLNISKNKLMGDEDSDPELRHGRFDVIIRPDIARYEDI